MMAGSYPCLTEYANAIGVPGTKVPYVLPEAILNQRSRGSEDSVQIGFSKGSYTSPPFTSDHFR